MRIEQVCCQVSARTRGDALIGRCQASLADMHGLPLPHDGFRAVLKAVDDVVARVKHDLAIRCANNGITKYLYTLEPFFWQEPPQRCTGQQRGRTRGLGKLLRRRPVCLGPTMGSHLYMSRCRLAPAAEQQHPLATHIMVASVVG